MALYWSRVHCTARESACNFIFQVSTNHLLPITPIQVRVPGAFPEVPTWFPGARLNFAENILRRNDDSVACTTVGESGTVINYSFRKLRSMVENMAAALRVSGLEVGDRVAGASITIHISVWRGRLIKF